VATVELDEGVRLMSNIEGAAPDDIRSAPAVRLAWSPMARVSTSRFSCRRLIGLTATKLLAVFRRRRHPPRRHGRILAPPRARLRFMPARVSSRSCAMFASMGGRAGDWMSTLARELMHLVQLGMRRGQKVEILVASMRRVDS